MGMGSDVLGSAPGISWHRQHWVPEGSVMVVSPVARLGKNRGTWKLMALPCGGVQASRNEQKTTTHTNIQKGDGGRSEEGHR